MTTRKKKNNKNSKQDLMFIFWLGILTVGIIIVCIFVFNNNNGGNNLIKPLPSPSVPSPIIPSESSVLPRVPTEGEYKNVTSQNYVRGSNSDSVVGVISLDKHYVFGNTYSSDGDFSGASGASSQMFLAEVKQDLTVEKVSTFGVDGDDAVISGTFFPKINEDSQNGILFVSKNNNAKNKLYLYKYAFNTASPSSLVIDFNGDVEVVKVNSDQKGITVFVNEKTVSGNKMVVLYCDFAFSTSYKRELNIENATLVDAYLMGNKNLMLINTVSNGITNFAIASFINTQGSEVTITKFSSSSSQNATAFSPQASGGFLITVCETFKNEKTYKIISVNKDFSQNFVHELQQSNYVSIKVILDTRANTNGGYYIFATRELNGQYKTTTEFLTFNGELVYQSMTVLDKTLPKEILTTSKGLIVMTETLLGGVSYLGITKLDTQNKEVYSTLFDKFPAVGIAISSDLNNKPIVFGSGTISASFKSDIFMAKCD